MNLPELSIKRHVLAWMLNAVLVLFGVIAYQRIGVDKLPYIEFPVISVQTTLKGANPDVIDASITNVIEGSVNSVPGIEYIQSTSSPGLSQINITFNLDKRIDVAFNEVQAKVNQVLRRLPDDADPPVVAKVETGASPVYWIAISGDRTQQQLNTFAINIVKKKLETVDGVGEVRVGGRRDRTIRVNVLPGRMAALNVTAQDVADAFAKEHIQVAGGFLIGRSTESLVKLDLEFHRLDDLEQMIVAYREGAPVRLRDIAEVEDGLADFRQLARRNGELSVGLGIVKIANSNTVDLDRPGSRPHRTRGRARASAGNSHRCRVERRDFHPRDHRYAEEPPRRRHLARGGGRVAVPAQPALDNHHRARDSGVADGRGRGDLFRRLHLQLGDDARAAASHRGGSR